MYGIRFKSLAKPMYLDEIDDSCMLVDIREIDEACAARIKGVPNIREPQAIYNLAIDNPTKKIVVHCKIGARAAAMGSELVKMGCENIYFFDEGFGSFYDKYEIVGEYEDSLMGCE